MHLQYDKSKQAKKFLFFQDGIQKTVKVLTINLDAKPSTGGTFVVAWSPESTGRWKIRPRDPSLAARAGEGTVLEQGRGPELVERGGHYAKLYHSANLT